MEQRPPEPPPAVGPDRPFALDAERMLRNQVKRQEKRRKRLLEKARETKTGFLTFLIMAQIALNMVINNEPDPRIRQLRRDILLSKLRRYSSEVTSLA